MDVKGVEKVLVAGAGVMGHSIAQVFAQAGMEVNLLDLNDRALERAMDLVKSNLWTLAAFGRVPEDDIPAITGRIHLFTHLPSAAEGVHFAMETVSETTDAKRELFSQLDRHCPKDTVLASNTSSLDIFSIVKVGTPQRLVVAHWFAPPHIIPLVEVVPGPETLHEVVLFTAGLMERIGKRTVIMERFVPSFIVNRIQNSISRAVWEMLEKGWATPREIDLAVKLSLGIRLPIVGVVQTNDFTGLDLLRDIMSARGSVSPLVEEKVKQGHLGAKTSRGIYDYGGRSEEEILRKRDERYLRLLDHLERIRAFDPI
jgi:3-hydroxybutyryl-CoA dehydrogenase